VDATNIDESAYDTAQMGRDTHVAVVQSDDDITPPLDERADRLEAHTRKLGMVEHPAAIHQVEALGPEDRAKEIHLKEGRAIEPVHIAKSSCQLQRVGT